MTAPIEMDYTNRDYDSLVSFLVSAARGFMPEWVTVGETTDFGTLLLELFAYVGDVTNYYIDRVAAEPFLATAQRRQSVLGIADMLGYTPIAQQAASGIVTFTLDDTAYLNSTTTIPSGTVVQTGQSEGQGAVFFETTTNAYLGQSVRTADIGVNEGRTIATEYVAISNGAPMQEYVLMNAGVIHRSTRLYVQETDTSVIEWSYVDNLVVADPDASVWTTYLDDQQFLHIVFGDNVAGRIPPNGAQVTCSYRYGAGARGNVAGGTITQITPPIAGVSVVNAADSPCNGGADNESIDQMRYSIPRAAKLRDRAITLQDFADLAHQVPGVAKATATGQFYTNIKVYIAPVGGGYPSVDLRAAVDTYLTERALVGTAVDVHPLSTSEQLYQQIHLALDVHVRKEFGQLTVANGVRDAMTALFAFDSSDFGKFYSQGDVYHAALAVTGVDYIVLKAMQFYAADNSTLVAPAIGDLTASPILIPLLDTTDTIKFVLTPIGGLT
jgi:hypothetical protein